MSLIHQALKKVEASGAQGPQAASVRHAAAGLKPWMIAALAIAALFVVAVALYPGQDQALPVKAQESAAAAGGSVAATAPEAPRKGPSQAELNRRGMDEYAIGEFLKAAEAFKAALEAGPASARMQSNLAAALNALGKKKEAEDEYRKALALGPGDPDALNNYGSLLYERGDARRAADLFRKAASAGSSDAVYNLAIALESLGDLNGAIEYYERYISSGEEAPAELRARVMALRSELILKEALPR